jgi:hypothetical protein
MKQLMRRVVGFLAFTTLVLSGLAKPGKADIIFSSQPFSVGGVPVSAQADFHLSGTTLTVTLTNNETGAATGSATTLTGLIFNSSGAQAVGPFVTTADGTASAAALNTVPAAPSLVPSSFVNTDSLPSSALKNDALGQNWNFVEDATKVGTVFSGFNSAIHVTGYSLNGGLGGDGNFASNGVKLDGGAGYGIDSANNTDFTVDGFTNSKNQPLVNNLIVFTLTTPAGFSLSGIGSTVEFAYGTNPEGVAGTGDVINTEPPPVPEPTRLVALSSLCGIGLIGLVWRRRSQAA